MNKSKCLNMALMLCVVSFDWTVERPIEPTIPPGNEGAGYAGYKNDVIGIIGEPTANDGPSGNRQTPVCRKESGGGAGKLLIGMVILVGGQWLTN